MFLIILLTTEVYSQCDKLFEEHIAEFVVNLVKDVYDGGSNIKCKILVCDYSAYDNVFLLNIDIEWNGKIMGFNLYKDEGILRIEDEKYLYTNTEKNLIAKHYSEYSEYSYLVGQANNNYDQISIEFLEPKTLNSEDIPYRDEDNLFMRFNEEYSIEEISKYGHVLISKFVDDQTDYGIEHYYLFNPHDVTYTRIEFAEEDASDYYTEDISLSGSILFEKDDKYYMYFSSIKEIRYINHAENSDFEFCGEKIVEYCWIDDDSCTYREYDENFNFIGNIDNMPDFFDCNPSLQYKTADYGFFRDKASPHRELDYNIIDRFGNVVLDTSKITNWDFNYDPIDEYITLDLGEIYPTGGGLVVGYTDWKIYNLTTKTFIDIPYLHDNATILGDYILIEGEDKFEIRRFNFEVQEYNLND